MKTWGAIAVLLLSACDAPAAGGDGGTVDANLPATTLRAEFGVWEGSPPTRVAVGPIVASWPDGWIVSCRRTSWDGAPALMVMADGPGGRVDFGHLRLSGDLVRALPGATIVTVWRDEAQVTGHTATDHTNECLISGDITEARAVVRARCTVVDGSERSYIGSETDPNGEAVVVADGCD